MKMKEEVRMMSQEVSTPGERHGTDVCIVLILKEVNSPYLDLDVSPPELTGR